ncbi:sulfurtransferase TusA family protein [Vibrio barjaei]|jgi:TusA-related sulfurtransferase|uniref:Sulfurtransferase TusA family protein n=1 Tax=Vibrio barjaei TaxID=1676683 RepID=A0ABW7IF85_9VIBR|nr:sulfurtransferase TusA family protein [Vibrio barjaei]MCY9870955.1 sulfurtransferase TusA family protein [Vibrio barjaei]OIN27154.1 hypothetical protein AWH66_2013150 [Vibrio barjaei]
MTDVHLDLVEERCPMSLLLVKRAFKQIEIGQLLSVRLVDKHSVSDVLQYLSIQNAAIHHRIEGEVSVINIRKQDD